jgi:hypothetical protein
MLRGRSLSVFLTLLFGLVSTAGAELVIVGDQELGVNQLNLEQVRAIWLGQLVTIGRSRMVAGDLPAGDELREEFLRDVLKMSLKQYRTRRTKLAFTAQVAPPEVFPDQVSIRKWVAAKSSRVAYLRPGMVDSTVKVLFRVR